LKTSIVAGGKVIDSKVEQVGFRFFDFNADKGFSLNGIPVKLKGVCFHDDAGIFGTAVPASVWERRLKILKAMGCNAIRMSHNPHQDYLYELCDRLGFLVQDEAFDEWTIGKNKWIKGWNVGKPGNDGTHTYFEEWSDRDLTDMIFRNRNRTSIIMWSIGNEIDYPNDPYTHEVLNTGRNPQIYGKGFQPQNPPAKELGDIARRLVTTAKKADATRPITAALAGVVMSNETEYPDLLDVVGYNYQEYRYQEDHQKYPKRIIYGSENGKSYDAWNIVEENDFIAGQFLWTGIDFLGEARSWPNRSSSAGLIDMAGFPKPQYYHRKALWINQPTVYGCVSKISYGDRGRRIGQPESHWNWKAGDSLRITAFANTKEVELFVNKVSRGKKALTDYASREFFWNVVFEPGEVEIRGVDQNGKTFSHVLQTAGDAESIGLIADRKRAYVHEDSVVHIALNLLDKNGRLAVAEDHQVEISISGPGKIIGLESGNVDSHENYQSFTRNTWNGKLMIYIRAIDTGTIKVEAMSAGLTTAQVIIKAVK
jgi:hypothetical protein